RRVIPRWPGSKKTAPFTTRRSVTATRITSCAWWFVPPYRRSSPGLASDISLRSKGDPHEGQVGGVRPRRADPGPGCRCGGGRGCMGGGEHGMVGRDVQRPRARDRGGDGGG